MMRRPPRRLPLLDADVIAHSEQTPFSYCLLLFSEGRLKRPLFQFRSVFLWVACNVFFFFPLRSIEAVRRVLGAHSNAAYQSPRGTEPGDAFQGFCWVEKSVLCLGTTHSVFILFIYPRPPNAPYHIQPTDCHVYSDGHDTNAFSSRFTPDMGNATPLMVTRPPPEKPSRAEWGTGWRSCWISSRTSICQSGGRQVSLQTICPT